MTTQYVQGKNNYWMSLADGSGPYVLGPGGAYALEGIQGSVRGEQHGYLRCHGSSELVEATVQHCIGVLT